jgi:hypothetical protein
MWYNMNMIDDEDSYNHFMEPMLTIAMRSLSGTSWLICLRVGDKVAKHSVINMPELPAPIPWICSLNLYGLSDLFCLDSGGHSGGDINTDNEH